MTSNATGQKRGHSYDSDDDLETEESHRPGKKRRSHLVKTKRIKFRILLIISRNSMVQNSP